MKFTKALISLTLLVLFLNLEAQEGVTKPTFYFDEDLNQINKVDFVAKSLTKIYSKRIYDKDSMIIKKLIVDYDFGQFNTIELQQLHDLLKKEIGISEFDKSLILVFRDTLGGSYNKDNKKRLVDADFSDGFSEDNYLKRKKRYDKEQKKCNKFAKQNDAIPLHFFSAKQNYNFKSKNYKEYKISVLLKSIFFKGQSYGLVILKPNGQYFFYKYINQLQVEKMLNSDWANYIKDLNTLKVKPLKRDPVFLTEMYKSAREYGEEFARKSIEVRKREMEREAKYETKLGTKKYRISVGIPHCYGHAHF
ncbi:hypothetical protein [Winogradskyella sp. PE311]|uniref:hypothetical protein n=1 Tax=Winogradskyella sp. PE311 TaxID=3366943 RepID=UPI00398111CB